MKIAIAGSSGFVGQALRERFAQCVIIDRSDTVEKIVSKIQEVDVVINLAGAPIIKRWSTAYKKVLLTSRIDTTRKLVTAINASNVSHFISASAIGIYPNNIACDETCQAQAGDFLSDLVVSWEKSANACEKPTTIVRFGVVLAPHGGALAQMLLPFRLGLGGRIGDGHMMMSWITLEDLVRIIAWAIETKTAGTLNATAPHPVSNARFTRALGAALHRPTWFPLPVFVLKLLYGQAASVLTDSKEVYPKALIDAGFEFGYPTIEEALQAML